MKTKKESLILALGDLTITEPNDLSRFVVAYKKENGGSSKLKIGPLMVAFKTDEDKIISGITTVLQDADQETAVGLFNSIGYELKARLLIPGEEASPNLMLARRLQIGGGPFARAFLVQNALPKPRETKYTTVYMEADENLGKRIADIMSKMTREEAEAFMEELGIKVAYLVSMWEMEGAEEVFEFLINVQDEQPIPDLEEDQLDQKRETKTELQTAFFTKDVVPLDFPFLSMVQEKAPKFFESLVSEIQNRDWPEIRNQFYELQLRNQSLSLFSEIISEEGDSGDYMTRITKD